MQAIKSSFARVRRILNDQNRVLVDSQTRRLKQYTQDKLLSWFIMAFAKRLVLALGLSVSTLASLHNALRPQRSEHKRVSSKTTALIRSDHNFAHSLFWESNSLGEKYGIKSDSMISYDGVYFGYAPNYDPSVTMAQLNGDTGQKGAT